MQDPRLLFRVLIQRIPSYVSEKEIKRKNLIDIKTTSNAQKVFAFTGSALAEVFLWCSLIFCSVLVKKGSKKDLEKIICPHYLFMLKLLFYMAPEGMNPLFAKLKKDLKTLNGFLDKQSN